MFERSASYGLKSYILRKNKHSNPSPSISPFKITTKTFKGIKTINTFREYRCL
ncbi:flavodoxin [Clostridium botulinum]